jgi:hypothetical protein
VVLCGPTQVLNGRKTEHPSFSEHLNYLYSTLSMVTKENTILNFDTLVLEYMSAATTHIMSKYKKGMLLHY